MVYTPFFDKYILKREVYTDTKLAEILSDIETRLGALESKEDTNTQPTPLANDLAKIEQRITKLEGD